MKKLHSLKFINSTVLFALIFLGTTCAAVGQIKDFPTYNTTPTGKGIMLMNAKGAPDFAILIPGATEANYDATDSSVKMKTNVGEISVYHANAKLYTKTKTDTPETLMKNFRAAQIAKVETERKQKLLIDEDFNGMLPAFDMRRGLDEKIEVYTSFWSFLIKGTKPERRIYLAAIVGDSIFVLRKDLFNGEDAQTESSLFVGAMKTLTIMPPQKLPAAPKRKD